jgi:23S rRNA pseudouridine2605 synthase
MRLNKWLVLAGAATGRRQADELIRSRRIEVSGAPAGLGTQVEETDQVSIDGRPLSIQPAKTHVILFHKPVGVVSSHRQQGKSRIVFDYLPKEYHADIIVGRLDKESEGLVLLTNNGQLAHEFMHPSHAVERRYLVRTKREISLEDLKQLHNGIELDDGLSKFMSCELVGPQALDIRLEEGRNRQIRRTLAALRHQVTELIRVSHGAYDLTGLKAGEWRLEEPIQ